MGEGLPESDNWDRGGGGVWERLKMSDVIFEHFLK